MHEGRPRYLDSALDTNGMEIHNIIQIINRSIESVNTESSRRAFSKAQKASLAAITKRSRNQTVETCARNV